MDHYNSISGSVRHGYNMTSKKKQFGFMSAMSPAILASILLLLPSPCMGVRHRRLSESKLQLGEEDKATSASSTNLPRILTVLTTYNKRTQYIKAYREVAANRTDGYEPMIFVTSDEEDTDPDGVIDYKFEEPGVHRLLAAVKEAISRYSGQFDWIAAGDDDTVFMYRRAMALLRHIDPKQPIAISLVHGTCDLDGRSRGRCQCLTPEERSADSTIPKAGSSCCLDFTQPCEVPRIPERNISESSLKRFCQGSISIYDGDLYWPYGGSGFFMSSGLIEAINGDGDGWQVCREMFGRASNTDMQVGRCLLANGFTLSSFEAGFHKLHSAELEKIRDAIASECQIIGVHAGLRHRRSDMEYTTDDFKATVSAIWAEDNTKPWLNEGSLETECPETWATVSKWIK